MSGIFWTIVIAAAVALWVLLAVRAMWRTRKRCGCGGCGSCGAHSEGCSGADCSGRSTGNPPGR